MRGRLPAEVKPDSVRHLNAWGIAKKRPRSQDFQTVDMGLCPIAPPKGFPSVYGARLAHRPLETFGHKYFVLFGKD